MDYKNLSRKNIKILAKEIEKENKTFSKELKPFARERWGEKAEASPVLILAVYRSRDFLATVYEVKKDVVRISVNRTSMNPDTGAWLDGISWDSLQSIKDQLGYKEHDAIEIYPREKDIVNVANIRHLWIHLTKSISLAWRKEE